MFNIVVSRRASTLEREPGLRQANERVCAIVLMFHPTEAAADAVSTVAPQVQHVCIVDNGSPESDLVAVQTRLRSISNSTAGDQVTLIRNHSNLGIGAGFNAGIRFAIKNGFGLTLLLDQDSITAPGAVKCLLDVYGCFKESVRVGAVCSINVDLSQPVDSGPSWFDEIKALYARLRGTPEKTGVPETFFNIFSGTMVSTSAVLEVGSIREDYFIDGDDREFCFRLRENGWSILVARAARIQHRVGFVNLTPDGLARAGFTRHASWRSYYVTRNNLCTARTYLEKFPLDVLVMLASAVIFESISFATSPQRAPIVRNVIDGFRDFLQHRMGESEYPESQ